MNTRNNIRRISAALIGLVACQASVAATAGDYCIVGDNAIGCHSEGSLAALTTRYKDPATLRDVVNGKIISGECRFFSYGERVSLVTTHGVDRVSVRRRGDKAAYWMPESWSRPATECEANTSAATLRKKLGLQEPAVAQTDASPADEGVADNDEFRTYTRRRDEDSRFHQDYDERFAQMRDDDRFPYPPGERTSFAHGRGGDDDDAIDGHDGPPPIARRPSRPLPSATYAHRYRCTYKPVMSDAEVAACRDEGR